MLLKISVAICLALCLLAIQDIKSQNVAGGVGEENRSQVSQLLIQLPPSGRDIIEWLTNMTGQWATDGDGGDAVAASGGESIIVENDARLEPMLALLNQTTTTSTTTTPRSSRRARKLFKNMLQMKPKVSPLYLVNGTVCRFVNTQPICTTLSTSGLFRGQNPLNFNGQQLNNGQQQQNNNLFPQNQQLVQQQQQQQQPFPQVQNPFNNNNNNIQPNQRQG